MNAAHELNINSLVSKLAEMKSKLEMPTAFVMTKRSLATVKCVVDALDKSNAPPGSPVHGTPIEAYDTVLECLNRMMEQRQGERLQLIMTEELPVDCLFHPFIKKQVEQMGVSYGF